MHKHYNRVPAEAFQRLNDLDIFVTSKVNRGTRGFGRLRIFSEDLQGVSVHPSTIPGYTLEHIPRCNRSGGGVGVFFKDGLRLASSKPWPADSFECMEVVFNGLTASSALRLFVIYRPPSSGCYATPFSTFLVEFRDLVAHASMQQAGLALLGNFNVKYGNGDNKDARDFAALLEDSNLIQLVSSATHIKGNILGLVIAPTTDSVISDVSVDALLTDYHAIVCHLNLPKPRPVQKQITYRKYC